MSNKADLATLLAETSGSARHKSPPRATGRSENKSAGVQGQGRDQSHHRSLPETGAGPAQNPGGAERHDVA